MKRIIINADKCVGCLGCMSACVQAQYPAPVSLYDIRLDSRGPRPRNAVYQRGEKYYPVFCRSCDDPDCVAVCMSGALKKNEETGLIEYDPDRCAACYMCVMSCRYGHPVPDPVSRRVIRCTFCQDTGEKEPRCVKACPTEAIVVEEVETCRTI